MTSLPRNISHLPLDKGMTGNARPLRRDSRRIPTVTPDENPNEPAMTSETPFQPPNGGGVSNLPENMVGSEARAAVEANLQRQMSVLQDRLSELHAAQEIGDSSPDYPHPSAVYAEEIAVLRQLVEDLRMVSDTLRARSRRFSGLTLESPPQYQTG
jgi:hypothetical protein